MRTAPPLSSPSAASRPAATLLSRARSRGGSDDGWQERRQDGDQQDVKGRKELKKGLTHENDGLRPVNEHGRSDNAFPDGELSPK